MIELVPEPAHVASLLSEAVAEKPAIPLPNQLMQPFVVCKLCELLVVIYFNNASYIIDLNDNLSGIFVMFTLAELDQAAYFRNSDANGRKITGQHCTEFIKNTVVTF